MDRKGLNIGYFTAETKRDGKTLFEFTTCNHPGLRKKGAKGVRVFAWSPKNPSFKTMVSVPAEKEDVIRGLIERKIKIIVEFKNDKFVDVYNIVPMQILA